MPGPGSGVCFVIAPIGGGARKWSDVVLRSVIEPAIKPLGLVVVRADVLPVPGMILDHVTELLFRAELVVADVTTANPNVFYEMGIRHVVGKPIVHIARAGETLPFDVAGMRTVFMDLEGSMPKAIRELRSAAESALQQTAATPISHRYHVTVTTDSTSLFGEHLADALTRLLSSRRKPESVIATGRRRRYILDVSSNVIAALDAIPAAAVDMFLLVLERLANGSATGAETSSPHVLNLRTAPIVVDGLDVPAITLDYTINDDRIIVTRIDTKA